MSRQDMFNKFLEVMNRFAQIKAIVAVKDGFIRECESFSVKTNHFHF